MNYKPYKHLPPFKGMVLQNFPFIEEDFDAITNYQLLCKVVEYLKNVIANELIMEENITNLYNSFTELKNYVDDYFKNLDVQEEINNKLDDMVEDGTLDNIVSKYINIQENNYIYDICTLAYRPTSETRGLQGGCYCGGNIIACYFTSTHTIQIISLTTGQVLREYSNEIFGHGNGMCYKDGYLYLCGTGDANNNVYKIPFDTLNSYEVIDVFGDNLIPAGTNISSICYSPNTNHFYITQGLPFPTLYCYELNDELTELINTYSYNTGDTSYGGFITNICYWNKYIVLNYQNGKTQLFNDNDFTLYKNINIDKNVGNRYYSEVEWLDTYENNELIIGAICDSGEGYGNGIFSFGTCNLHNSYRDFPTQYRKGRTTNVNVKQNNVYVNTNAAFNVKRDGSYENPFISIYEATNSTHLDGYEETIITILSGSDITNEGIYLFNNQKVKILFTQDNGLCRDMRIQSCENVYIRGILPIGELYLKESNLLLYSLPTEERTINLNGFNTSVLTIESSENKIKLQGKSEGIINFTNCSQQKGIVGILNSTADGYEDFINMKVLNNVKQRCRLSGSAYTPTTSMTFFLNKYTAIKSLSVQVGSGYYIDIPFINTYHNITYNITLPDSSLLNVKISDDSSTYEDRTVRKIELSHPTLNIFDAMVCY